MADKPITFILSDESVNAYGFWVKTSGINLVQFRKNPVMLYNHDSAMLPIGQWVNIRVENGRLLAEPKFDEQDDFAREIARKVETGVLRGASVGLKTIEVSEEKKDLKPGQTRRTVTKSVLYEASITGFPANRNALKLSDPDNMVGLLDADFKNVKNNTQMKAVLTKLNLSTDTSEQKVVEKIVEMQTQLVEMQEARNKALMKLGEQKGGLSDELKAKVVKLADNDIDLALDYLDNISATQSPQNTEKTEGVRLSDVLKQLKKGTSTQQTYRELVENNPEELQRLHKEDFATFNKLYKAEYGKDYVN